jgi:mannose-6-phosphate isomerase-like protein (cupin superfamily)
MKPNAQDNEDTQKSPPASASRGAKGYLQDIEERTLANSDFRRVLYTAKHFQLVVMSIPPGEDIGEEVHRLD